MTETIDSPPATPGAAAAPADERLVHRGPLRRWFISPEIGALIGAVVVWAFFWGNSNTFGTAGTTLNWLDVAAPTGIMATAVALLMIGGEFDLSAGVMTGGTAMIIGLMSRFFTGQGINIGWAIAAAFLAAAAIGWFNGFMVNRTGLPSFIITLASFYAIRGLMLVLSKRLAQKVYVDQITDQRGAKGFKNWIAHEWKLTEFSARDKIFVALVIVGAALFVYGLIEQSLVRLPSMDGVGLGVLAAGLAAALGGFAGLLTTDGATNNTVFGAIGAIGIVLAIVGLARARWQHSASATVGRESVRFARPVQLRLGLGLAGVAVACAIHVPFDRNERTALLSWASPGFRVAIAVVAALGGIAVAVRSALPSLRLKVGASGLVKLVVFGAYAALVVMTLVVGLLQLATVQAVRAIGMIALASGGLSFILLARGRAAKDSRSAQLVVGVVAVVAALVLALVIRGDSTAERFRSGMFAAIVLGAALILANTLVEFLNTKRTSAEARADRFGRRLQVAGAALAVIGLAIRLLWTNFTAAHAQQLRDNGRPVPTNVLRETVVWWLVVAVVGAYVLTRTRWGNWIFAVGGNKDAARAIGVPANQVKIALFVVVGLCGALSGTLIALRYGTVQADQGTGNELEYIIAAVVGGCLMTGGYGSVVGASLGAAIMAMSTTGVQTTGWNSDGRFVFLGGILLIAVVVNNFIRKKAQESR